MFIFDKMTENISVKDEEFILHPSGAIYWEKRSKLMISDVHLGKITHFRKFGMAIPSQAIYKNFQLLQETIDYFNPQEVIFLGDLFHSSLNREWDLFEIFIKANSISFILVMGNHDSISMVKYKNLGINIYEKLVYDAFLLTHFPEEKEGYFNFSGHIHPAIKLKGMGKQSLKLPCFYKKKNQIILPAFGEFTGSYVMKKTSKVEVFAIANDKVIKI